MKKYISLLVAFAAGWIVGYYTTNKMAENKYKQIAQEEIDAVTAAFNRNKGENSISPPFSESKGEDVVVYTDIMRKHGYLDVSDEETKEILESHKAPYVITPDEFGCNPEYEQISFTFYADQVLVDDGDRVMTSDEIEASIGLDSLTHFGEYEEDAVHVRNDRRRCEYEILFDYRNYSDVLKDKPYLNQED